MQTTKIRQTGNSYATTIPREAMEALGLKPGDDLQPQVEDGRLVYAKPSDLDALILSAHRRVMERYRFTLQELAK